MDAAQALGELRQLSSQITAAVVVDGDGAVLAASPEERGESLAATATELLRAAAELGSESRDVTRVEIELEEGAVFVVCEGDLTVAATTGPDPTSGLVVYDLRTCAQSVDPPKKRRSRKPKEDAG
ncbi:MAG TPA: roadblock/LC7 domain-containing protein [Gaiellaceae bacterium]|nr:roadblock/LC7 domain-containing protein [Gaiellaceae bacterium]